MIWADFQQSENLLSVNIRLNLLEISDDKAILIAMTSGPQGRFFNYRQTKPILVHTGDGVTDRALVVSYSTFTCAEVNVEELGP